jgi:hypothetical protein
MIAHEIEHLIEQAEGLDLRALANQAKSAGQIVAREFERHEDTACDSYRP